MELTWTHSDDEEDEDEMDEDDYIYDDDYPHDAPPPNPGGLDGWDALVVEPGNIFGGGHHHHHHHRGHRHGVRSPFPPVPFMGGPRDPLVGDFRSLMRGPRSERPTNNEDDINLKDLTERYTRSTCLSTLVTVTHVQKPDEKHIMSQAKQLHSSQSLRLHDGQRR